MGYVIVEYLVALDIPGNLEMQIVSPLVTMANILHSQPIKFYQLASTLHAVTRMRGSELINQNVVRSISSIQNDRD